MDKILSVIVPAYNSEDYIERCLSPFVRADAETRKKLEIIIVNDGSTDGTEKMVESYVEKYPYMFKLCNKENGGHGSAINHGVKYVAGKYFHVVDSDDWMNLTEIKGFVRFLEEHDVDVVANSFLCVADGSFKVIDKRPCISDDRYARKEILWEKVAAETELIRIHAITFKREFYLGHNIYLDSLRYYDDFEYTLFPMAYARKVAFYEPYVTSYRLGRSGQSVSIRSMQKNRDNHMKVIESLLKFYDGCSDAPESIRAYLAMGISKIVENQFQIYISLGNKKGIKQEVITFDKMLLDRYPDVYNAVSKKSIWMLRRTGYNILPVGYLVYKLVKRNQ